MYSVRYVATVGLNYFCVLQLNIVTVYVLQKEHYFTDCNIQFRSVLCILFFSPSELQKKEFDGVSTFQLYPGFHLEFQFSYS